MVAILVLKLFKIISETTTTSRSKKMCKKWGGVFFLKTDQKSVEERDNCCNCFFRESTRSIVKHDTGLFETSNVVLKHTPPLLIIFINGILST